jgi:outer membrane protein assembly factor BamB
MLDLVGVDRIPWRTVDSMQGDDTKRRLDRIGMDSSGDVLHLNSVEVIDRDTAFARSGDLLVCLRSLDLVLVIDRQLERIVWGWSDGQTILDRPHHPTLLANGNLLVFDNGWRRGTTRVVEVDPLSSQVVWQYPQEPSPRFFTKRGGLAQPLPNGNLLITESDRGHVFEITRSGDVVWDFWNPRFARGKRQTVYRAWRWTDRELTRLKLPETLATTLAARGLLGAQH